MVKTAVNFIFKVNKSKYKLPMFYIDIKNSGEAYLPIRIPGVGLHLSVHKSGEIHFRDKETSTKLDTKELVEQTKTMKNHCNENIEGKINSFEMLSNHNNQILKSEILIDEINIVFDYTLTLDIILDLVNNGFLNENNIGPLVDLSELIDNFGFSSALDSFFDGYEAKGITKKISKCKICNGKPPIEKHEGEFIIKGCIHCKNTGLDLKELEKYRM